MIMIIMKIMFNITIGSTFYYDEYSDIIHVMLIIITINIIIKNIIIFIPFFMRFNLPIEKASACVDQYQALYLYCMVNTIKLVANIF